MATEQYAISDEKKQIVELGTSPFMSSLSPVDTLEEMEVQVRGAIAEVSEELLFSHPEWHIKLFSKALLELQPYTVSTEDWVTPEQENYVVIATIYYGQRYSTRVVGHPLKSQGWRVLAA